MPRIFKSSLNKAVASGNISDGLFVSILLLLLISGLITDYIGVYSVFGGFIAGVALPKVPGFASLLHQRMYQVVKCFFLPIFFAYAGLNTFIWGAFSASGLLLSVGLVAVAIFSKALPSVLVLRLYGWQWGETTALAGLMNARGLMVLISATIGLLLGIIETEVFSIMVLIAVTTTALALPIYRTHFTEEREDAARQQWNKQ